MIPNPFRQKSVALGVITPSANVVVERITTAILADFPAVSGHFSRISVVGAQNPYSRGYDWDDMMRAAHLLGHARPDVISWNGSKGGSIGFAADHDLCARITAETGRPASTSTIAVEALFQSHAVRRFGLVTPYTKPYQDRIIATFAREGYACIAESRADLTDNFSYCEVDDERIARMVEEVAEAKPDAVLIYCTNFPAAPLVDELEQRLGLPIFDSVSIGVWHALSVAGVDTRPGRRWGSVFASQARP